MSEIILVRPGQTEFDAQERIQGLLDLPLSEQGRQYIGEVAANLAPLKIDLILCDPGEPARTTALQLGEALGVNAREKSGLRNLDQGLWQGLEVDQIRRRYPRLLRQWQDHPETICPPGGEAVSDAMSRVQEVLKKLRKKYKRVVIVAADPLATLIAGMLRDSKPEFSGPMCSHADCGVEHFSDETAQGRDATANGYHAAVAGLNGHANGNGQKQQPITVGRGHEYDAD